MQDAPGFLGAQGVNGKTTQAPKSPMVIALFAKDISVWDN